MKQSELVRRLMIAYTEPRSTFGGGLLRLIEELETEERAAASGVPVGQAHAVPRDEDNLAKSLWDAFVSAEDDAASSAFFDAWSCIEQFPNQPRIYFAAWLTLSTRTSPAPSRSATRS